VSVIDELVRNADSYGESFSNGDLPMPPAKRVAVVACMDARLNPYGLLGLQEGDAHVIRNAGGVITTTRSARLRSRSGCSGRKRSC
jgi:carbonic anhydrase